MKNEATENRRCETAYYIAQQEVAVLLARVEAQLKKHVAETKTDSRNWGRVGDMNMAATKLNELLMDFGG